MRRDVMTTEWPFFTARSNEGKARRIWRTEAVFIVKHVCYTNRVVKPAANTRIVNVAIPAVDPADEWFDRHDL